MTFLWFIDLDFKTRLHHGATLRYLNYSRELVQSGHRVYLVVEFQPGEAEAGRKFFSDLKELATFTDFFGCTYSYPRWKGRIATLSVLPSIANRWLAPDRSQALAYCEQLVWRLKATVCLFSNRRFFFLLPQVAGMTPSIVDFGDCATLYHLRQARLLWRTHAVRAFITAFRYAVEACLQERYYGRRSHANVVVSGVDKKALDRISGCADRTHVLLNGVSTPARSTQFEKVSGRLIFSGNMNFPPNYQAAIWFIDHVLPAVRKAHPEAHLVIAGANPVPELMSRASHSIRVTGYVEDMNFEIAHSSLYVAPLITGGGFKNKVVEALSNRTYVAATPMALEFLDADTASKILVGNSAESLAGCINQFLSDPGQFQELLADLHLMVLREFTWESRTRQLARIVREAVQKFDTA